MLRAILDALDQWATHGILPPDSRIPRRADGTMVPVSVARTQFPCLPGVCYPEHPNRLYLQDFASASARGCQRQEPPREDCARPYATLVPCTDADGNELPGIRTPHLQVPLATFTGWNPRPEGYGSRALASIIGSYLLFAATYAERQRAGDPRPSVAERYRSRADYIARIVQAAQTLVASRLLLAEDVERYVERALHEPGL